MLTKFYNFLFTIILLSFPTLLTQAQTINDDFDYDDDDDRYTLNIYVLNEGSVRVFESGSAIEGGTGHEYSDCEQIPSDVESLHLFVKPDHGMMLDMLIYDDGSEEYMEWDGAIEPVVAPGWDGWLYLGNDIMPSGDVTISASFSTDLTASIKAQSIDRKFGLDRHEIYYLNGVPCKTKNPAPGYYITIDSGVVRKILIR